MESPTDAMERLDAPIDTALLTDTRSAVEAPRASSAPPGCTESTVAGLQIARTRVWLGSVAVAVALALWGQPMSLAALCLALVGMAAAAMVAPASPDRTGIVGMLPAGFVVLGAWAVLFGLMGGAIGLSSWSMRWMSYVGLLGFGALTGLVSIRRGGRIDLVGEDRAALAGFLSLCAFWVWVIAVQPFEIWARINASGTDFLRHLAAIQAVREQGSLAFGQSAYPQGLHALGGWITSLMGLPTDAQALWQAVAPLGFLMTSLILLAIMTSAGRLTRRVQSRSLLSGFAAAVAGVTFAQTAWFSTYLAFGNLTNMVVAVCLLALLITGQERGAFGSTTGTMVCASALMLVANAWQLLIPVIGVAALPWIGQFLRRGRRRVRDWAIWVVGGVGALHGVVGLKAQENMALVSAPTVSNLFRPDWWWWVATAFALLAIVAAFSRGLRTWAMMASGIMASAAALIAILVVRTGSSWELLRYYPVKALWTSMVVVIPLAAAGAVLVVSVIWDRAAGASRPAATVMARGAIALLIGIVLIGVAGRGAAFPPHLTRIAEGRSGLPNWQMALIDSMTTVDVPSRQEPGAIVFGLVPSASMGAVQAGYMGVVDFMAMESLRFLGIEGAAEAPVKPGLSARDMTQVCRYLLDHPDSLRITGPNPAAGARWIIDSGCPEAVVKPERWVSVALDSAWLERSPWEDGKWSFPTFDEVQKASALG